MAAQGGSSGITSACQTTTSGITTQHIHTHTGRVRLVESQHTHTGREGEGKGGGFV